jgi:hypothetical protein
MASISVWLNVSTRVIETTYAHVIPQAGGVDFLDRPQASANLAHEVWKSRVQIIHLLERETGIEPATLSLGM